LNNNGVFQVINVTGELETPNVGNERKFAAL
jgi:hypothetical protein